MNWSNSWDNTGAAPDINDAAHTPPAPAPEPAKLDDPLSEELKARLIKEKLPTTPDGLLMLWQRTQQILADAKADEMEIRKTAVKVYVPKPVEGMNNVDLGSGFTLKAAVKFNYKLADNKTVEDGLDKISKISNEASFIADRLIGWTPNFYVSEYREIQKAADEDSNQAKEMLRIIETFLTITDAAPTLEIKAPKVKK